jgi:peptide/nickel transport system substrate-binding protein
VFGPSVMEAGNYDMFLFAWQGSPDPAGNVEIWKCHGGQNFSGYCNQKVSKLLEKSNVTVQPKQRQALFNKADALMANDLPTIPLFQKPTFFVYSTKVHGMKDNSTNQGPTWNAEQWWLSS